MEVLGDYFIERVSGYTPAGEPYEHWDVGKVVVIDGRNYFKKSAEFSAETREDALIYIGKLAEYMQ